jgi:hypothetical protein
MGFGVSKGFKLALLGTQFLNCGHLFDPFVLDNMWLLFKEEFEDTKGVIRIRISKKKRQHNSIFDHLTFGGWGIFLFVNKKPRI